MQQKGFTLIEMLVVVAVIGILSSVILTALGPAKDKAKDSRIIQEVNQVRSLAETMYDGDYDRLEALPAVGAIADDNLSALAEDITLQGGELVIIKSRRPSISYATYSRLNVLVGVKPDLRVNYYCVDSRGRAGFTTSEPDASRCPF